MKRSAMVRKIVRVLLNESDSHFEDLADAILERLEEQGMLPPATHSELEYHESTGKQLQTKSINKWENE